MQVSNATIAATRFGFGPLLGEAARDVSVDALLESIGVPDPVETRHALADLPTRMDHLTRYRKARKAERSLDALKAEFRAMVRGDFLASILRPLSSAAPLRERLVLFWADHFTVAANGRPQTLLASSSVEEAIRPALAGRFPDMLRAVFTHPGMLVYLNQAGSAATGSRMGKRRGGLNENLAREALELHTLGVDGSYGQADVRALAEALAGLSVGEAGFRFRAALAAPGPVEVLGKRYNGKAGLTRTTAVLEDLALMPQTARHLSRKLCVHFLGAAPDDLIDAMARAYLRHDGALMPVYEVLLSHPQAWSPPGSKVRPPLEYVVAILRALGAPEAGIVGLRRRDLQNALIRPLTAMGQPPGRPGGPDGWPEDGAAWITPSTLAARITFAVGAVERLGDGIEPVAFLSDTLGDLATPALHFAVAGAETRSEGLALTLASPQFNRR